jgi:hypothetical protein
MLSDKWQLGEWLDLRGLELDCVFVTAESLNQFDLLFAQLLAAFCGDRPMEPNDVELCPPWIVAEDLLRWVCTFDGLRERSIRHHAARRGYPRAEREDPQRCHRICASESFGRRNYFLDGRDTTHREFGARLTATDIHNFRRRLSFDCSGGVGGLRLRAACGKL